jgi:hypothetical protein
MLICGIKSILNKGVYNGNKFYFSPLLSAQILRTIIYTIALHLALLFSGQVINNVAIKASSVSVAFVY